MLTFNIITLFQANEHGTHGLSGNPLSLPHPTHLNIPSSNASNNLLVLSNLLEGQSRLPLGGDKEKESATASLMSVSEYELDECTNNLLL